MNVTNAAQLKMNTPARTVTLDDMQKDLGYEMAQMITKSLFDHGLISEDEMKKIMKYNKETFEPIYKELL